MPSLTTSVQSESVWAPTRLPWHSLAHLHSLHTSDTSHQRGWKGDGGTPMATRWSKVYKQDADEEKWVWRPSFSMAGSPSAQYTPSVKDLWEILTVLSRGQRPRQLVLVSAWHHLRKGNLNCRIVSISLICAHVCEGSPCCGRNQLTVGGTISEDVGLGWIKHPAWVSQ